MYVDASGEVHFEFWNGVQMDGRTFKSFPLFQLCLEFGTNHVTEACRHLGCFPYTEDLATIKQECVRTESNYV